jgi:hypothetical protein
MNDMERIERDMLRVSDEPSSGSRGDVQPPDVRIPEQIRIVRHSGKAGEAAQQGLD